jgi:hypothetical protein
LPGVSAQGAQHALLAVIAVLDDHHGRAAAARRDLLDGRRGGAVADHDRDAVVLDAAARFPLCP